MKKTHSATIALFLANSVSFNFLTFPAIATSEISRKLNNLNSHKLPKKECSISHETSISIDQDTTNNLLEFCYELEIENFRKSVSSKERKIALFGPKPKVIDQVQDIEIYKDPISGLIFFVLGGIVFAEKSVSDAKFRILSKIAKAVSDSGPSKLECNTAYKLLTNVLRLAVNKFKLKLSNKKKQQLIEKISNGTISSDDLPGTLQRKFPTKLKGKTLNEVLKICGRKIKK